MKLILSMALALLAGSTVIAGELGEGYILYDFTGVTTAWDKTIKTAPASTNTFAAGITASDYTITTTSGRENAIIDDQTKAKCSNGGSELHSFTVTIPKLGGRTLTLTGLSFDFDTTHYDQSPPFTAYPAGWALTLSKGSASKTSGAPTTKTWTTENITLSDLENLKETSVTFTIQDTSGGNNMNTYFYTGLDNVRITGKVDPPPGMVLIMR